MKGKLKIDYWIIKFSGLFDPFYYLKHYPDVRIMDIDPLEHYVLYGWKEGKNPNSWFDTKFYMETNPEIKLNPFSHWILFGRKEGRKPNSSAYFFYPETAYDYFELAKGIIKEINIQNLRKAVYYLKNYGIKTFLQKLKSKASIRTDLYRRWIEKNEPSFEEIKAQENYSFFLNPRISIVTPVYNTEKKYLIEMIESVLNQTYKNWELCIVDGNSSKDYVKEVLEYYRRKDKRIKVKYLSENKGIAENTNEAIKIATGDYIAFLDHDDILPPFALFEIAKAINENPDADFIYSDEDKISADTEKRFDPHFKPDWNPELLRSYNYITHLIVIKKELINSSGLLKKQFEGSQDYDLILRCTEKAKKIIHIPKILYHWRAHRESAAEISEAKLYAFQSGKKALKEHLKRMGYESEVEIFYPYFGWYRVRYKLRKRPKVSIIISGKEIGRCVKSILEKSTYRNFEIIAFGEEKTEGIRNLEWKKDWNWASANNYAVQFSSGKILLFLHSDTEVINPDWLERMLEHIQKEEVAAVGAKLYYPDNTIQHAGVIIGIKGIFGYSHRNYPKEHPGYFGRLISVQNVSAVTGACMMVKKEVFEEVEGFSEEFTYLSDIDFCLKLREKGYLIVWTPFSELYHYEDKNFFLPEKEVERFKKRWSHLLKKGDPYYSPNLTLEREDFSVSI